MFKPTLRRIVSVLLAVLVLLSFASCNRAALSPAEITESIKTNHHFSSLSELSGDKLSAYFQFNDSDVKRFSVYISNATESSDVIAAFEFRDDTEKSKIMNGVSLFLNNKAEVYKNNFETEYQKIQNRIFMQVDSIIVVVICEDYRQVETELKDLGGQLLS